MKYYLAKAKKDLVCIDGERSFIGGKTYMADDSEGRVTAISDEQEYTHVLGNWGPDFEIEEIDEATYNLLINL